MTPTTLRLNASLAVADGPVTWATFRNGCSLSDDELRDRLGELRGIVEARLVDDVLVVYGRLRSCKLWPSSESIALFIAREKRLAKPAGQRCAEGGVMKREKV